MDLPAASSLQRSLTELLTHTGATRRSAVAGLLAGVVGSWTSGAEEAQAAGDAMCRAVPPDQFVSKNSCQELSCGSAPGCICIQTLGHVAYCVTGFDPTSRRDCPKEDECSDRRRCRSGFVCAKVKGCCGASRRKCLRRCPG